MSWQDRPYSDGYGDGRPELRIQFRKPGMLATWLLIANVAVFFVQSIIASRSFDLTFGLSLNGIVHLQVWQLGTYMFLHSGFWHLFFNMLMLYFVGSEVERGFGRDRFLILYAVSGVVGGLAYLLFGAFSATHFARPLVGASGAVWGLLMVAMIFYPSMQIIFYFFPVPIRVFGAIMLGIFVYQMATGTEDNPGGQLCHLGGAMAAVGVLALWGMAPRVRFGADTGADSGPGWFSRWRSSEGAWARKQKKLAAEQAEVDRILEKVHREGINSLTRKERNLLATATKHQRERDEAVDARNRV
jgi:membrane associated rhomboid family serine protease